VITLSVLFSLKCTINRLAAGLCPDPLGSLSTPPDLIGLGIEPPRRSERGRDGKGSGPLALKPKT